MIGFLILNISPLYSQWGNLTPFNSTNLNAVYFADDKLGYAVGDGGLLIKTNDGGKTWVKITIGLTEDFYDVFFLNQDDGFIVGEQATLLVTTNGGVNWSGITIGISTNFNSIFFTDAQTGIIAGDNGYISKTTNSGAIWTQINSGVVFFLTSIHFSSKDTGYVTGSVGTLLKTTDGGDSWTSLSTGTIEILSDVFFLNGDRGYAVGKNGTIIKTTNGGSSFTKKSASSFWLKGIHCTGNNVCTTVGLFGTILQTTDGNTWNAQAAITSDDLNDVQYSDKYTGYSVGGNGELIKTCPKAKSSVSPDTLNLSFTPQAVFTSESENTTNVQWFFGDGKTTTTTNPTHGYDTAGTYVGKLIAYNETDCADSLTFTYEVIGVLSVPQYPGLGNLKAFPNPFTNKLAITFFTINRTDYQLAIYNSLGKMILDMDLPALNAGEQEVLVNTKNLNLSTGIYLIKLTSPKGLYTKKVVYLGSG